MWFDDQTVHVNGRAYRQLVRVGLDAGGIRLDVCPAFRPFHRPLLIPWDDVATTALDEGGDVAVRIGESAARVTLTGLSAAGVARVLARRAGRGRRPGRR